MTPTPSWLYRLFAVLTLVVAAYCFILLGIALVRRQKPGWDVDVSHVFMGVSMAGMFIPWWAFGPKALWELAFAVLMIWFVVRSMQLVAAYGVHLPHTAVHAAMSFAMLLMYWFPMSVAAGSTGSALDPGVALVLAFTFAASAVFTLGSRDRGRSHHGAHVPVYVMSGAPGRQSSGRHFADPAVSVVGVEGLLTRPRLEDASHVVMCLAMGFLLILLT